MSTFLVIASATMMVEADSAEEAREEAASSMGLDWEYEIEDVQEYDEGPDHVMRPKTEAK